MEKNNKLKIKRIFRENLEDFLIPTIDNNPMIVNNVRKHIENEFDDYSRSVKKLRLQGVQSLFNDISLYSRKNSEYGRLLSEVSEGLSIIYANLSNQPIDGFYEGRILKRKRNE